MELTPKQQTSEAVRQAETIVIVTGQRPNVDQVAAVLALSAILRKFGKQVSAIISDPIPGPAQFLDATGLDKKLGGLRDFIVKVDVSKSDVDKLRYEVENDKLNIYISPFKGGFESSDVSFGYGEYHYDLAIALGVPSRSRIDQVVTQNEDVFGQIPLVNIDYHRVNESYGAVNLIEPNASSLAEILIALAESLQPGLIDADIATIMLTGLMAATDRFTAPHTTSKSLTVGAQMMAAGARQQDVAKGLFNREDPRAARTERNDRPKFEAKPKFEPKAEVKPKPQPQPQPEPVAETKPQPEPAEELVIQPDHIELMQGETLTLPSTKPEVDAQPEAVSQPGVPMADFAAAAEILRERHSQLAPADNDDVDQDDRF